MATLTATAKLTNAFRVRVVDKNISAAITSTATVAAVVRRTRRTTSDLESTATLANTMRYATKGAGTVTNDGYFVTGQSYTITTVGDSDWNTIAGTTGVTYVIGSQFLANNNGVTPVLTGAAPAADQPDLRNAVGKTGKASLASWTVRSTLVCEFPTYIEIDIEALMLQGLPEGTDCVLNFQEGWQLEDRGRQLPSGAFEYSTNTQDAPSPEFPSFVTFRTPKFFRSAFSSVFSIARTVLRIKQLGSTVSGVSTLVARGTYNPGKFASLFGGAFITLTAPVKKTGILFVQAPYQIISTIITNGLRARVFNVAVNSESSVSVNTTGSRVRKTPADLFLYVNVSSAGTRSASLVPTAISSNFTINAIPVKEVKTITTEAVTSSLTCKLTGLANALCNITSTSTLESNSDLVFTYYGQNFVGSPFVNSYYAGQYSSDATIFWGDGTSEVVGNTGPNRSHAYPSLQEWTIRVRVPAGSSLTGFNVIDVNSSAENSGYCIRKIKTFGQIGIVSLYEFTGNGFEAAWIDELPDHLPPTVRNLYGAFRASQFWFAWNGTYAGRPARDHNLIGKRIQNWDVSRVTNFQRCFADSIAVSTGTAAYQASIRVLYSEMDLRLWNTESATNMIAMFEKTNIDQDLSGWCVPLIASAPSAFYSPLNDLPSRVNANFQPPVWGTCP